jgi:AAA domain (dynein-related subfamily)
MASLPNSVGMVLLNENVEYFLDFQTQEVLLYHIPTGIKFKTTQQWISTADPSYIQNWIRKIIRHGGAYSDTNRLQSPDTGGKDQTMLEELIKMYNAAMRMNVRALIPHLVGPPGVGKTTVMRQLSEATNVKLHIVNVSRISPLEIEGVQMPHGEGEEQHLKLLLSTLWSSLREGDIVLFDEFLRGFPEVYNGLLDIISEREVAGFKLPNVFFVAASNSIATYDRALEDRLLHIQVPDLRSSLAARNQAKIRFAAECGFIPEVATSAEMDELFTKLILPTYRMLDFFQGKASLGQVATMEGKSARHLTAQVHLRKVQCNELSQLVTLNNQLSINARKWQYVVLLDGKNVDPKYVTGATKLVGNARLSEIQANNLALNLDLIQIEEAMKEEITIQKEEVQDDDTDI